MGGELRGVRGAKVWRALNREGLTAARCTVARLMGELGLRDLYKTVVIRQRGPWRHLEGVEFATLE